MLLCGAIGFAIGYFLFRSSTVIAIILGIIGLGVGVYLCVAHFFIWFNFRTKNYNKTINKKAIDDISKELKTSYFEERKFASEIQILDEKIIELEELKQTKKNNYIAIMDKQINHNNQNIISLEKTLNKYYDLNIIPQDYRTVDCIITLDHIFRNDLADTVREAILLYEEWVFRGVIVKGIENIQKMLGNLSSQMQYMQQTLDSIDANVSSICSDMYRMVEFQESHNRTQEQILLETQCSRQATEAIKRSNEKYEWYVEQHRQGLL